MRVAILGAGAIGSTFAFYLARAGHEVTLIARGARLEQLRQAGGVVSVKGVTAKVTLRAEVPPEGAFDLLLVTVLGKQVEQVLPALKASRATTVMFMFNAFDGFAALREAVGRDRFAWGFPAVVSALIDGRLDAKIVPRALAWVQITTVGGLPDHVPPGLPALASAFSAAGIPTVVHPDLQSWLRSHAALMTPLMLCGAWVQRTGRGLTVGETRVLASGMAAGFARVRQLGGQVTPWNVALVSHLPRPLFTLGLWLLSRSPAMKALGEIGTREGGWLLEAMLAAPDAPDALLRLRAGGPAEK